MSITILSERRYSLPPPARGIQKLDLLVKLMKCMHPQAPTPGMLPLLTNKSLKYSQPSSQYKSSPNICVHPGEGPPNAPRVMEGGGNTEGILIFFFPLTPASSTVNSLLLRSGTKIAFLIKEQCIDITNYSFAFSKAPHPNPLLSP